MLPGAGAKTVGWPHVRLLYCISVLSFGEDQALINGSIIYNRCEAHARKGGFSKVEVSTDFHFTSHNLQQLLKLM